MNSWLLVQSLINGLLTGGIYALVAVGITIIFGVMKMVNFAMGEFLMYGMYMTWIAYRIFKVEAYYLIPVVVIAMAAIAYMTFKLCLQPILGQSQTSYILVTVGLSFFLMNLAQMIWGPNSQTVPSSIKNSSTAIFGIYITHARLFAFLFALLFVVLISLLLNKTLLGRAMRATAEKPEVAEMLGVNTERTFLVAFVIGIVMAGVAGLLLTPIYYVNPQAGTILKTTALMVVVLGGMGSIKGALIGGLLVGLVEALCATLLAPDLGPAGIFVVFLVVLYFRPQGLFGRGERMA